MMLSTVQRCETCHFVLLFAGLGPGVLYANIVVAITMLDPQWWLQTVIKQVCLIVD